MELKPRGKTLDGRPTRLGLRTAVRPASMWHRLRRELDAASLISLSDDGEQCYFGLDLALKGYRGATGSCWWTQKMPNTPTSRAWCHFQHPCHNIAVVVFHSTGNLSSTTAAGAGPSSLEGGGVKPRTRRQFIAGPRVNKQQLAGKVNKPRFTLASWTVEEKLEGSSRLPTLTRGKTQKEF